MRLNRDHVLDRKEIQEVDEDCGLPLPLDWRSADGIDIAAYILTLISRLQVREQDVYDLLNEVDFGNPLILMLILNENAEGRADKPLWYRDELGYLHPKRFARIG